MGISRFFTPAGEASLISFRRQAAEGIAALCVVCEGVCLRYMSTCVSCRDEAAVMFMPAACARKSVDTASLLSGCISDGHSGRHHLALCCCGYIITGKCVEIIKQK